MNLLLPWLQVDVPIKYLGFFLDDDKELERITEEYRAGRILTGEVKKILIDILVTMVERHRRARAAVTEEVCCINLICLLSWRILTEEGT